MTDKFTDISYRVLEAVDEIFDEENLNWPEALSVICGVFVTIAADAARDIQNPTTEKRRAFFEDCAEKAYDSFVAAHNELERHLRRKRK